MLEFVLAVVLWLLPSVVLYVRLRPIPTPYYEDVFVVLCRLENRVHIMECHANRKLKRTRSFDT